MVLIYKVIISRVLSHCLFNLVQLWGLVYSSIFFFTKLVLCSFFCSEDVEDVFVKLIYAQGFSFRAGWHAWEMRYLPFYHAMTVSHLYCYRQQFVWNFRTKLMPLNATVIFTEWVCSHRVIYRNFTYLRTDEKHSLYLLVNNTWGRGGVLIEMTPEKRKRKLKLKLIAENNAYALLLNS